jgi:hypothetical protein
VKVVICHIRYEDTEVGYEIFQLITTKLPNDADRKMKIGEAISD